uniref:Uncharacterized protein n=1 Tax=Anguilla anguilla TaxID=7936 RepID=A0A0E9T890_ANGAN
MSSEFTGSMVKVMYLR